MAQVSITPRSAPPATWLLRSSRIKHIRARLLIYLHLQSFSLSCALDILLSVGPLKMIATSSCLQLTGLTCSGRHTHSLLKRDLTSIVRNSRTSSLACYSSIRTNASALPTSSAIHGSRKLSHIRLRLKSRFVRSSSTDRRSTSSVLAKMKIERMQSVNNIGTDLDVTSSSTARST